MRKKDLADFNFRDLDQVVINFTILFMIVSMVINILWLFGDPLMGIIGIVGLCVSIFIAGPACWVFGVNKQRDGDFAYLFGLFFGLIGMVIYWFYTLLFEVRKKK